MKLLERYHFIKVHKIAPYLILGILLISCSKSDKTVGGFTITGAIQGVDDGFIYLQESSPEGLVTIDSSELSEGQFYFTGKTELPEVYYLKINNSSKYITFFLENSDIAITGHKDSLYLCKITGSKCQNELDSFYSELNPYKTKLKALYKSYYKAEKKGDEEQMREIDKEYEMVHSSQINHMKEYALANPNSIVASYVSARYLANELDYASLDTIYTSFEKVLTNTKYIARLKERLSILENVAVGKPALNITQSDTSHNLVSLESLKGNYVLIEFWASWCIACKDEHKVLKKIHSDYRSRGFEVFAVSLDNDHSNWVEAIQENELPWVNVSDLKGWQSETRTAYGVTVTPHNILVDPEGIIVAKNIYGDEIREVLEKVL